MSTALTLQTEWFDPDFDSEEAQVHDYTTVSRAIATLRPAQKRRLEWEAGRYNHYLHRSGWQPPDLVQEVLCRTLSGVRSWSVHVSLMTHLIRSIGSIAFSIGKRRPNQALLACELGPSGHPDVMLASELEARGPIQLPFEDRVVTPDFTQHSPEREALLELRTELLKRHAPSVCQLFDLLLLGHRPRDIRWLLNWSESTYRSRWQSLQRYAEAASKHAPLLKLLVSQSSRGRKKNIGQRDEMSRLGEDLL